MKMLSVLALITNITVLGTSLLTQTQLATAEPAPVFRSILGDIQRQLPRGWVMRLPSKLYMTDYQGNQVKIYPRFDNYLDGGFAVFLETMPNCQARACSFAVITVAREYDEYKRSLLSSPILSTELLLRVERTRNRSYETWTEADKELLMQVEGAILVRERITLTKGVQGSYIIRNAMGASTPSSGTVIWEQGGFIFGVSGPGGLDERYQIDQRWRTELIDVARSMSTEQPILSTRQ